MLVRMWRNWNSWALWYKWKMGLLLWFRWHPRLFGGCSRQETCRACPRAPHPCTHLWFSFLMAVGSTHMGQTFPLNCIYSLPRSHFQSSYWQNSSTEFFFKFPREVFHALPEPLSCFSSLSLLIFSVTILVSVPRLVALGDPRAAAPWGKWPYTLQSLPWLKPYWIYVRWRKGSSFPP